MSVNFNPPEIVNKEEIKSEVIKVMNSNSLKIVFTGENNSGKSFLLDLILKFERQGSRYYISNRNTPGSKGNLSQRVFDKEVEARLYQLNQQFEAKDIFEQNVKGGLETTAFSHSTSMFLDEKIFDDFKVILKESFIKKNFFGDMDIEPCIIKSKKFIFTTPEEEQGFATALGFNEEHYHWGGEGLDQIIFLLSDLVSWRYVISQKRPEQEMVIFLDEPERGLSVKNQKVYRDFLYSDDFLKEFPFVKKVYIATHSHVFLERLDPSEDGIFDVKKVIREDNQVQILLEESESILDLSRIKKDVLGLSFEDLELKCLLFIEGRADFLYLDEIFKLKNEDSILLVKVKDRSGGSSVVFSDVYSLIMRSNNPFIKIRGLVDSLTKEEKKNSSYKKIVTLEEAKREEYLYILDQPGIEYFYPDRLVELFFEENPDYEVKYVGSKINVNQTIELYLNLDKKDKERKKFKTDLNSFVLKNLEDSDLKDKKVLKLLGILGI